MTTQKMTTKEAMHILRKEEYVSPYTQEAIDTVCDALEASERGRCRLLGIVMNTWADQ